MNKTTLFLVAALLTTMHHHQTKPGVVQGVVVAGCIAGVAIFFYKQLQESQKTEVDKVVDTGADATKKGLNAAMDKFKELTSKK